MSVLLAICELGLLIGVRGEIVSGVFEVRSCLKF